MGGQRVRLTGVSSHLVGKVWESESLLRIGRMENLEVDLDDSSISRRHAEVAFTEEGWVVRDLGSTNGTFLNGTRLECADQKLRPRNLLQCGNSVLAVSILAGAAAAAVEKPGGDLPKQVRNLFFQTVAALSQAVEMRDRSTGGHTQRVTDYALMLAKELDLSSAERYYLRIGTPLHDIGKIGIDDAVLRKPGRLSAEESKYMQSHTVRGAVILETIPDLAPVIPIVRSHHERWDGKGYPDGLAGAQIPLLARIVAVADVFDALTNDRPYRRRLPLDQAFDELREQAGAAFDPKCVEAFLNLRPRLEELLKQREAAMQTVILTGIEQESSGSLLADMDKAARLERYMAYHDALTRLPNRRLFHDRLSQAIVQARRHGHLTVVLFLDLDGFKGINDTLGHGTGDRLLQTVARRLKSCVRESDTVARLGGDEFAVVLGNIVRTQDGVEVAQKVLRELSKPAALNGHDLHVTTSIGISQYPADGADVQTLVQRADLAMYRAKREGKNTFQLYNASMAAVGAERQAQEKRLRKALDQGELVVHYQVQRDIASNAARGVESLLRWRHPKLGLLTPAKFMTVAEESGCIVSLGEWVLRTACAQSKAWQAAGLPLLRTAVNLSARQFRERSLPQAVARALEETGLSPGSLVLEICESTVMQDVDYTLATLKVLKEMGVQLLVDGFGTGAASLSYLKRLPLDLLKIDQSFVQGLPGNKGDKAVAAALVALAHSLEMKVIAKHVETREQLQVLRALGCDEMQGFLCSPPLDADALAALLQAGQPRPALRACA